MTDFELLARSGPQGLARDLSTPELSSFGVSSSAPMTVQAGAFAGVFGLGVVGVPLWVVAVCAVLALWVVGYAAMSQHVQSAGAQSTFIARGIGRRAGVSAYGLALVAYPSIYTCLYGLFGYAGPGLVQRWTGLHVSWVWCALAGAVLVGALGRARIKLVGRVLKWLLAAELAGVLLIDLAGFVHPAGGHYDLRDVDPRAVAAAGLVGVGGVLAYAVASMVGFEETPGLAEEARNGKRDVRRALLIAVGFLGVLYGVTALALSVGEGPTAIAAIVADPGSDFPYNLLGQAFGEPGRIVAELVRPLLLTSCLAAAASFHTICARYLFAAGRDGVLPAWFARINPRRSTPTRASDAMFVLAVVVIVGFRLAGADPFLGLFAWGSYVAAVGVLALMVCSSLAVVGFFARSRRLAAQAGHGRLTTLGAPLLSAVLMAGMCTVMVLNAQTMIGAKAFGPLHLTLLGVLVAGLAVGVVRALTMSDRHSRHGLRLVGQRTPAEGLPLENNKVPEFARVEL
jgi:amino acid transporter